MKLMLIFQQEISLRSVGTSMNLIIMWLGNLKMVGGKLTQMVESRITLLQY